MPQGKNLEHFISQLQQGIQHCTQETHRVPGSREAVVGNWGTQLQWKVSSSSSGNSCIIVVVAGILVGCLRSNRVPASSSHTSWANQVVAYYTSVGKLGSIPHQLGKLAGVGYQCLVLGHTRHYRAQTTSWANQQVWTSTRQCQIRVRFESGVKTKFLAALNQLLTSFVQCHNIPWSHSFPKRYDMYIVKING